MFLLGKAIMGTTSLGSGRFPQVSSIRTSGMSSLCELEFHIGLNSAVLRALSSSKTMKVTGRRTRSQGPQGPQAQHRHFLPRAGTDGDLITPLHASPQPLWKAVFSHSSSQFPPRKHTLQGTSYKELGVTD
jgi:hypothetical protein